MTGWLPVYHQTNKMTAIQRQCPGCQNDETIAHMFQCGARLAWRTQFSDKLRTHLQKIHTSQKCTNIIINAINDRFQNNHKYQHFKHFTMFAGLLPNQWHEHLNHLPSKSQDKPTNPDKRSRQLSLWMLKQGHALWKTCLLYTSPSPRDGATSRMPSSA